MRDRTMAAPIGLAALMLALACASAAAQVHRCVDANGQVVYQQAACDADARHREELKLQRGGEAPARTPVPVRTPAPPAPPAVAPPPVAQDLSPSPARSEIDLLAERCLDWYRPRLRDPRGAYHRDARYEARILSFVIHATNGFGGYASKDAACEFRDGVIEESWTRIQAQRLGWRP